MDRPYCTILFHIIDCLFYNCFLHLHSTIIPRVYEKDIIFNTFAHIAID